MALPPPGPNQVHVTISALDAGALTLPERYFVFPADPAAANTVPSIAFLITHPGMPPADPNASEPSTAQTQHMLFDLGLRGRATDYTLPQQAHLQTRQPARLGPTVRELLAAGGLQPGDVATVLFSHVHWDHTGDPEDFAGARFLLGPGGLSVLGEGLVGKGSHQHFDAGLFDGLNVHELPAVEGDPWYPLGPFEAALDLYRDGSVYIVNAPGHLPGHVMLLCRTEQGWVCLAGDAYHDVRLRTGEREIGTWEAESGETLCIHLDKEKATETIEKLKTLAEQGVTVVAAHDGEWLKRHRDEMFPRTIKC